jgi:hypothetical protein
MYPSSIRICPLYELSSMPSKIVAFLMTVLLASKKLELKNISDRTNKILYLIIPLSSYWMD